MCLDRETDREIATTKRGKRIATSVDGTAHRAWGKPHSSQFGDLPTYDPWGNIVGYASDNILLKTNARLIILEFLEREF
jgi:hypothetical protein